MVNGRKIGLIYGGDSLGVAIRELLKSLDIRFPGWRVKPSILGGILGALGQNKRNKTPVLRARTR